MYRDSEANNLHFFLQSICPFYKRFSSNKLNIMNVLSMSTPDVLSFRVLIVSGDITSVHGLLAERGGRKDS